MQDNDLIKLGKKSPFYQISTQTPKTTILAQHDLIFKPHTHLPRIPQKPLFSL